MKKLLLILTIFTISILSTACVNNIAIKELNTKAQEYLQKGDSENAICRLKASIDLNNELYETHYNLGIAYLEADKYTEAISSFNRVIELNPDYNDAYYSLGLANSSLAFQLLDKRDELLKDSPTQNLSSEELKSLNLYLNESVNNYNKFISNDPNAENIKEIKEHIELMSTKLKELAEEEQMAQENYNEDEDEEVDLN